MATYNLDDIVAAAEKKYASVEITFGDNDKVSLLNPIRLPKAKRDSLVALQSGLGEDGADQVGALEQAILLVADDTAAAKRLVKAIGGDLAVLGSLFTSYTDEVQAGEA